MFQIFFQMLFTFSPVFFSHIFSSFAFSGGRDFAFEMSSSSFRRAASSPPSSTRVGRRQPVVLPPVSFHDLYSIFLFCLIEIDYCIRDRDMHFSISAEAISLSWWADSWGFSLRLRSCEARVLQLRHATAFSALFLSLFSLLLLSFRLSLRFHTDFIVASSKYFLSREPSLFFYFSIDRLLLQNDSQSFTD